MGQNKIYNKALETAKFVGASDEVKLDILIKYGLMADVIYGSSGRAIIDNNIETFKPLISENIIKWVNKCWIIYKRTFSRVKDWYI